MSATSGTAGVLADRLPKTLTTPWDLIAARSRRFEVHLEGDRIEMRRGPIVFEGFGLRLFRPAGDHVGVGIAGGTDLSPDGVRSAVAHAESTARQAPSPATSVQLPRPTGGALPTPEVRDARLWDRPEEALESYAHELLTAVDRREGVVPTFGSVRAQLIETSITNSEGVLVGYPHTRVELEFAVKAAGGAEGRPPGEYWVNQSSRMIPRDGVAAEVTAWCQRARDVRLAHPTPTGVQKVVLPPPALADILPPILSYRFSGEAAVRKMAPSAGETVASPLLSVRDHGLWPGAGGSAPVDDEGTAKRETPLIDQGRFVTPLLDAVFAGALGGGMTGNAHRGRGVFTTPSPSATTLVVASGDGGTDEELMEAAGEGIWLEQLGYAFPDGVSGAFGGEIRLGYRIHHGKKGEPIRGGTVGGNTFGPSETPPLLTSITALGSRPMLVDQLHSPAFLVTGFPVAGSG